MPDSEILSDDVTSEQPEEGSGEQSAAKNDLSNLSAKLSELTERVTALTEENTKLAQANDQLRKALTDPDLPSARAQIMERDRSQQDEDIDFDSLSGKQLASILEKRTQGVAGGLEQKLSAQIKKLNEGLDALSAQMSIRLATVKYPELEDRLKDPKFVGRLRGLAAEYPGKDVEWLYRTSKLIDRMEAEEKERRTAGTREEQARIVSEKGGIPTALLNRKNLSEEEAAEYAYNATLKGKSEE